MLGEKYMNIKPMDNNDDDWFNRFFDFDGIRRKMRSGSFGSGLFNMDPFKAYEEMESELERMFGQFKDIQTNAPKELVREYQTPDGAKIREVGPLVYGYSMTIGPDGKPKVREFGNVRSPSRLGATGTMAEPLISTEREPLADVTTSNTEVKVI